MVSINLTKPITPAKYGSAFTPINNSGNNIKATSTNKVNVEDWLESISLKRKVVALPQPMRAFTATTPTDS